MLMKLIEKLLENYIELPFVYATQSSDIFAKGAIEILHKLKIDTLIFGTESENIDKLKELADIQINNKEYNSKVKEYKYNVCILHI